MSEHSTTSESTGEPTRRDFLYLTTGMAGAVGAVSVAWPFIDQMRPDASTLALASIEVDVSSLEPGMSLTVKWRGKPVFIRNRTQKKSTMPRARSSDLKDPVARNANLPADAQATDVARSAGEGKENWLVMIGVCTHLGCIPLGQAGNTAGGSVPAMVRSTIPPVAYATGLRRRTSSYRNMRSRRIRRSRSVEGS